jgi:hypothetical protein
MRVQPVALQVSNIQRTPSGPAGVPSRMIQSACVNGALRISFCWLDLSAAIIGEAVLERIATANTLPKINTAAEIVAVVFNSSHRDTECVFFAMLHVPSQNGLENHDKHSLSGFPRIDLTVSV